MKKIKILLLATLCLANVVLPSCATVLGGRVSDCQRTKPLAGHPSREVRAGYLILDILFLGIPFTAVDFITGAIYKPCTNK
jgi:hypothetical protein